MLAFLYGLICMGYLACALFFMKFWRQSRDRLFLAFSGAFFVLAAERLVLVVAETTEYQPYVYIPRLIAFLVIMGAVADKNRA